MCCHRRLQEPSPAPGSACGPLDGQHGLRRRPHTALCQAPRPEYQRRQHDAEQYAMRSDHRDKCGCDRRFASVPVKHDAVVDLVYDGRGEGRVSGGVALSGQWLRPNCRMERLDDHRGLRANSVGFRPHLEAVRHNDAYALAERLFDPASSSHHPFVACSVIGDLAEAAAHTGRIDAARARVRQVEATAWRRPIGPRAAYRNGSWIRPRAGSLPWRRSIAPKASSASRWASVMPVRPVMSRRS